MADPSTPQSMVGTPASSVGDSGGGLDHDTAMKIINLLQRSGYKNAEDALRRDMSLGSVESGSRPVSAMAVPDTPAPELASYETLKEDPSNYTIQYEALLHMVNNCLDRFKPELGCLLWPVFAHMYLELLGGGFVQAAHTFVDKFGSVQEDYYQTSIKTMLRINSKEAINSSDLLQALKDNLFCIRISRDHLSVLSPFVKQYRIIMEIMRSRMTVETMDSAPRPADVVSALKGGWLGESARSANKTKVHYGVIKEDFSSSISAESMLSAEGEEAKKKKNRSRDSGKDKSSKKDVNAPNPGRIPLPEWSDRMKQDRALAAREAQKMTKYGPDKHPSVCFYTILNAVEGASACTFSDDSTNVAAGFGDSSICVWSLNDKLSRVKPWNLLQSLDKEGEGDDVEQQMLETTNQDSIIFRGHHGPVYALSFSPDKRLLLSASEDSTVRLWSLQTWTNLCVYKGGGYPLWDVNFCNRGYYFVTGSADRMATLWSTDRLQPLRIFSGHLSDVNGAVQSVSCSSDGKYIASGGSDGRAIVWDIGMGKMLAPSDVRDDEQNTSIYSLAFSRDNNLLAFGGSNHAVRVLYLPSVTSDPDELEANPADPRHGKRPFTESLLVCNKIFPSTRSSLHEVKFVNGRLYRPFGASQAETNGGEEHLVPLSLSRDNMSGMSLPSYSNDVTSPEMEIAGEIVGGNFFADSKSRHADLKAMLDSSKDGLKMEAMKRIINMVAKGKDASELFPAVVKNVAVKNLEVKKLVYVYLVRYAEEQQDLALLSISTFQRALKDPNQLIRSSALRVLSSIRVPMIVPIMMLAIKESMRDMSSFVRKTAAHAIPKLYSLDPEQRDQLIEVIDHLLADRTTLVVGSAVYAFEEVCPERTDLIHKHYRKLCQLLVDVDEWGQVTIINMLTRYARTQFTDPNQYVEEVKSDKESEEDDSGSDDVTAIRKQMDPDLRMLIQNTKSLLNSRNAAVVVAVAQMYYHLAPRSEMGVIAKALIRLLRSHREVQSVVLSNIATISAKRSVHEQYAISKNMFDPFLKSFFVRNSDPTHIKLLKLEVLTNLANQTNISIILRELQTYVRTHDQELAASAIDAIGRCAANIQEVTDACLSGLVSLMSSKNATVVAQSVVVIKRLLQLQPESHHDIIRSMAKLVDTVKVPAARASIIWLIGEYCEHVPTVAPDVLRKMAKTFVQEDETVKQQVLNLSVKLLLTNPDQTQLLTQYVFSLARYDQSYDLRDRARFLKAIAMPSKHTHLSKKAKQIFLSTKPAPVIESTFKDRDQYQLGTLSHYLNQRCNGYNDLPEFPEQPPDPTVRNVAGWGLPEATKDKKMDLLRQKIKKGFYSDQEDETAEDEEEDEEESGESGSGSSEEDEEESESSEETSSSEEEVPKPKPPPPSKSKKQTKKEQPTGNTDLLLDIDFGGPTSNLSVPALAPAVAPLVPSSGSPSKQSYSKTYSESWMTAPPQVVPSKTYELLNKVSGSGLCVQYRFPRAANLYSSTICSVELQAENHSKTVIEDLNIVQKPGCGIKVEGLNSFEAVLGVGASVSHRLGIGYGDTTQPCLLELTATVDGRARKYSLTVEAPVGEQLVPILLSPEQFKGLRARLSGMNETSGKIHLGNSEKQEFVQKIYNLANVIEVTCVEDLCFSAQTLSTQSPVLIALSPFSSGIETKLTVNCDKMVVGSMLFKALKLALAN